MTKLEICSNQKFVSRISNFSLMSSVWARQKSKWENFGSFCIFVPLNAARWLDEGFFARNWFE